MTDNANATRLTPDIIADAERILSDGNRVELMPSDEDGGVRVFEITRREQCKRRKKRRLTKAART